MGSHMIIYFKLWYWANKSFEAHSQLHAAIPRRVSYTKIIGERILVTEHRFCSFPTLWTEND